MSGCVRSSATMSGTAIRRAAWSRRRNGHICESVISTLKVEWIKRHRYESRDQARLSVFRYIETFYNLSGPPLSGPGRLWVLPILGARLEVAGG
jgi:hypothetical protein